MTRPRRSFPLSARRGSCLLCPTTGQNFNSVRCSCTSPSLTQLSTRHSPSQHLHSTPLLLTHSIQTSTHVSCWCRHLLHHRDRCPACRRAWREGREKAMQRLLEAERRPPQSAASSPLRLAAPRPSKSAGHDGIELGWQRVPRWTALAGLASKGSRRSFFMMRCSFRTAARTAEIMQRV